MKETDFYTDGSTDERINNADTSKHYGIRTGNIICSSRKYY